MLEELNRAFEERLEKDKESLENILKYQKNIDPFNLPVEVWGNVFWEFMEPEKRDRILAQMFRHTLRRAARMPLYENAEFVNPDDFESMEQLVELPLLVKDGRYGFRTRVLMNPELLRPQENIKTTVFFSGGTKGASTPTYMTDFDLDIESRALAFRCFVPGALPKNSNMYNFYNPTHKGGKLIEDAAKLLKVVNLMTRRPEDDLEVCVNKIKNYKTDSIAAVQPPIDDQKESVKKGSGVSFLNLYQEGIELFEGVDKIVKSAFITGYALPNEIIELSQEIGLHLFTTWGATEALPGATSTVLGPETRTCKYNNQHLIYGPHMLSVVKIDEEKPRLAEVGEERPYPRFWETG